MQMRSWKVTDFGKPLEMIQQEIPEPTGTEVLVKVTRCGVCHSDLHIGDGYFDLGSAGRLNMGDRGVPLPHVLGHEILGEVVKGGPDAGPVPTGETKLIHPWIGCGECSICKSGQENHCAKPRTLGVYRDGGYQEYVLVPHAMFLVDIGDVDPSEATPFACSGVTVYSALRKAQPVLDDEWLVIMGAGGLGLAAVGIARAMGFKQILSCDIDDKKLAAAKDMGATATLNISGDDAAEALAEATGGGPRAVVDTVGANPTAKLGYGSLVKGGRYVIVGLYGGDFTIPLPTLPLRAAAVIGSYVGSLKELKELMELVKAGKVKQVPIENRPMDQVQRSLDELRAGKIVGRVVLTND